MMCALPTLLVLGECEGRTVDCGDKHPAGMVWVLSSQVPGRVAAESKDSQPTLSTSPFWAEGGDRNLFLISSLPTTHPWAKITRSQCVLQRQLFEDEVTAQ